MARKSPNSKPRTSKSSLATSKDPAALEASVAKTAASEKKPRQGNEIHLVSAAAGAPAPSKVSPDGVAGITDEQVRERAYQLYLERGGEHGRHDDDWYRAEAELRVRKLG